MALANRMSSARAVLVWLVGLFSLPLGCETSLLHTETTSRGTGSNVHGYLSRVFVDQAGNEHGYVVFAPDEYQSAEKSPVLLFLNGRGQNGDDGVRQIVSGQFGTPVWKMREFLPFLIVAPQCGQGGTWAAAAGDDVGWALGILDHVISEFGGDENRVYLTGGSAGGAGAWNVASAYPERFAAVVPLCGVAYADVDSIAGAKLAVWAVYNDGDAAEIVESNREARVKLIERGLSPLIGEYDQNGHNCWTRAYNNPALYGWLLEQSRERNREEELFDYLPAGRVVAEWRGEGGEWSVEDIDDGSVLLGRSLRAGEEGWLISPLAGEAVELHADFWLEEGESREVSVLRGEGREGGGGPRSEVEEDSVKGDVDGENAPPMLADSSHGSAAQLSDNIFRLAICLPTAGTGGVSDGHGHCLARLDPVGQRALQKNSWNEVRLRVDQGRLRIRLNGCPAVDLELPWDRAETRSDGDLRVTPSLPALAKRMSVRARRGYRCAFVASGDGAEVRWRLVRMRVDDADAAP